MKLRCRSLNRLDAFQFFNEPRRARRRTGNRQIEDHVFHLGTGRVGGASRDRTDDPLLAKQVLSHLSYGPAGHSATV